MPKYKNVAKFMQFAKVREKILQEMTITKRN